ncbi:hypothetical protein T492DRAFT_172888 [Pavlovales sp. CCMP2436]|nr:hypothetical protein T492DRAFT_172888 [Pavlovales sp. CCMP2436]
MIRLEGATGAFALIDELDSDLMLQVLSHLHVPQHVALVGAVNRRLHDLTASDMLWSELCKRWVCW